MACVQQYRSLSNLNVKDGMFGNMMSILYMHSHRARA